MTKSKFLVAIRLPNPLAVELEKIQDRFRNDRWLKRIGPHITLVRPFIAGSEIAAIEKALDEIADQHLAFSISFADVAVFENEVNIAYARVEPSPALLGLQRAIEQALRPHIEVSSEIFDAFRPHITLSNKLSMAELQERLPKLKQLDIRGNFFCDRFELFQLNQMQTQWLPICAFYLTSALSVF